MTLSPALLTLAALLLPGAVAAQTVPALPTLSAPEAAPQPTSPEIGVVTLSAVFASDSKPIRSGVVWRVFEDKADGHPVVVARSNEPAPSFSLPPGAYVVHAAYGFAGASKRIAVPAGTIAERLAISAGALKLSGAITETPIPPNRISFSVFVPIGTNSEGRLLRDNVKAGEIIRVPEGMYHVVSTYGESNAIMRSDIKVDTGRLTEATLNHRAATLTLKLVAAPGGESFAGTAFSVLTPGGDVIREVIGAFPTVTLAEGEYMVIARQGEQVYTREFRVESGLDRDVEVLAASK